MRLLQAAGVLIMLVGLIGAHFAYDVIDQLERESTFGSPTPMITRILPGIIGNPAHYLAVLNGRAGTPSGEDATRAVQVLSNKIALDRWMALAAAGLSLTLFAVGGAARLAPGSESTSVASDAAPFVLLLALAWAGFSFFEVV